MELPMFLNRKFCKQRTDSRKRHRIMEADKKQEDYEPEIDNTKSLYIFGRNVAEIPCFRNSFLYGIGAGFGGGLIAFMSTSRPRLSTHIGFGSFFCTTIFYWFSCRYQYSQKKFLYSQLQSAMKKQAIYEGTEVEKEVLKNAEMKTV